MKHFDELYSYDTDIKHSREWWTTGTPATDCGVFLKLKFGNLNRKFERPGHTIQ